MQPVVVASGQELGQRLAENHSEGLLVLIVAAVGEPFLQQMLIPLTPMPVDHCSHENAPQAVAAERFVDCQDAATEAGAAVPGQRQRHPARMEVRIGINHLL